MGFLLFIVYMFIGAFLCGLYTYLSSKIHHTDHEYDVLVAVLTGLFSPVVAPFLISIIVVKKMIEDKD